MLDPDNLMIAIPLGPFPVDSAKIFICFFKILNIIILMINSISFFNNKFGWISAIENNGKIIELNSKKEKKTQFVTKKTQKI